MAATVTSAWAKPGAWALDSEENEAELLQQHQKDEKTYAKINGGGGGGGDPAEFPSLMAAATTKTKKKKPQTMSLSEFSKPAAQTTQTRGLTTEDLRMLPTGPRERTADELDRSKLGGGFRSYDRSDSSNSSRWGSSRVSDEPRREGERGFGRDSSRELAPSRADEVDDWGATKKSVSSNGFDRRERGERGDRGGFFGSESRADESDSWKTNKSFVPSEGRRRVGFESNGGADSENWLKKKEEEGRKVGAFDSLRERRGGGFDSAANGGGDSDNWGKKREEGSGGGRPRLNLQPRTLPVGDGQENGSVVAPVKPKGSSPFGEARPREDVLKEKPVVDVQLSGDSVVAPVKPRGSNPFGEARPREEVLKEKGQDWKEIDEKLEAVKIKEVNGTDGAGFGRRSFGRATTPEGRAERSWRKTDSDSSADARPSSADTVESALSKEAEDVQE